MQRSPVCGVRELSEAIANHLSSFRGMEVDPNQILVGAGTEYLYGLITQLLGNDKIYAIENPGYQKLTKIYKQRDIDCRFLEMDEAGVTVEGLKKVDAEVAHICPNHHFPTGITMPASRRYEILGWATEKEGRYIIEDDYDSEFRMEGKPIPTLFSIDNSEKVIYMNTFSKSLSPTIRISYMVLPVHLVNRFYQTLSFYSCTVSNFEQYTLAAFIQQGYFDCVTDTADYRRKTSVDCAAKFTQQVNRTNKPQNCGLFQKVQAGCRQSQTIADRGGKCHAKHPLMKNIYHQLPVRNYNSRIFTKFILFFSTIR